jgi:hypothetical protein
MSTIYKNWMWPQWANPKTNPMTVNEFDYNKSNNESNHDESNNKSNNCWCM